jgi:hypothetical protein
MKSASKPAGVSLRFIVCAVLIPSKIYEKKTPCTFGDMDINVEVMWFLNSLNAKL